MTKHWKITCTTQAGETYIGKMTRQQPEIVNDFIALALDDGAWIYLQPDTVVSMHYEPVTEETTTQ